VSQLEDSEGWGIKDAVELCKIMEADGVAAIDIVSGHRKPLNGRLHLITCLRVQILTSASAIKKAGVKTPIWVAGKIMDPSFS